MDSILTIENPTLTALLTELAQVFQERDDFRDEVARLQEQYAETCETLFVARKDAAALRAKLENQNYLFGEVLAHPPVGPGRKNRPKLTSAQVGGIRSMVGNGSTIASVAKVYGVHPSTVSRIASGVYHKGEEHA